MTPRWPSILPLVLIGSLSVAALWLTACNCGTNEISVASTSSDGGIAPQPPPPNQQPIAPAELVEACPDTRKLVEGCADVDGWKHQPLFAPPAPAPDDAVGEGSMRAELEALLGPYCVYEWVGDGAPNVDALAAKHGTDKVHDDCIVMPAGNPTTLQANVEGGKLRELSTQFFELAGAPAVSEVAAAKLDLESHVPPKKVKVAVIDTNAHANRGTSSTTHGQAMLGIVGEIVGRVPGRHVAVDPVLAMPQSGSAGGYGTQSEVLQALTVAALHLDTRSHLIMNLSFGWEVAESERVSQLIREALRLARCRGALVFAAVGNTHPGSCAAYGSSLYPAAWESSMVNCGSSEAAIPLVFAVSALDKDGAPMLTNRRADVTFAALGHNAIVPIRGNSYVGPLSGSSVATAVTSATAAGVWAQKPLLDTDQVIEALRGGAKDYPYLVSPCRAWDLDSCRGQLSVQTTQSAPIAQSPEQAGTSVSCPLPSLLVVPQPPNAPCKNCGIKPPKSGVSGELVLKLDGDYFRGPTSVVELTLRTTSGAVGSYSYSQNVPYYPSSVTLADRSYPTDVTYAYVTMYFTDSNGRTLMAGNEISIINEPPPQ